MIKFAWHIHHTVLVEALTRSIAGRQGVIKTEKPLNEQKLRLRLLKPVKGKLPEAFVRAATALEEAKAASYDTPHRWQAIDTASLVLRKKRRTCAVAINKLHQQECLQCPWDARRRNIFPAGHRSY